MGFANEARMRAAPAHPILQRHRTSSIIAAGRPGRHGDRAFVDRGADFAFELVTYCAICSSVRPRCRVSFSFLVSSDARSSGGTVTSVTRKTIASPPPRP